MYTFMKVFCKTNLFMLFSHFQTQQLKSYSWFIFLIFDSNYVQNDLIYQTGGNILMGAWLVSPCAIGGYKGKKIGCTQCAPRPPCAPFAMPSVFWSDVHWSLRSVISTLCEPSLAQKSGGPTSQPHREGCAQWAPNLFSLQGGSRQEQKKMWCLLAYLQIFNMVKIKRWK
jgi:hypothetical protein